MGGHHGHADAQPHRQILVRVEFLDVRELILDAGQRKRFPRRPALDRDRVLQRLDQHRLDLALFHRDGAERLADFIDHYRIAGERQERHQHVGGPLWLHLRQNPRRRRLQRRLGLGVDPLLQVGHPLAHFQAGVLLGFLQPRQRAGSHGGKSRKCFLADRKIFIPQLLDEGRDLLRIGLLQRAFAEVIENVRPFALEPVLPQDLEIVLIAFRLGGDGLFRFRTVALLGRLLGQPQADDQADEEQGKSEFAADHGDLPLEARWHCRRKCYCINPRLR